MCSLRIHNQMYVCKGAIQFSDTTVILSDTLVMLLNLKQLQSHVCLPIVLHTTLCSINSQKCMIFF